MNVIRHRDEQGQIDNGFYVVGSVGAGLKPARTRNTIEFGGSMQVGGASIGAALIGSDVSFIDKGWWSPWWECTILEGRANH